MLKRQQGYSYLVAMFTVAVVAVLSTRAIERTSTMERRNKEAQLLFVGQAYLNAIQTYYQNSPGTTKQYPPDLPSLLQDTRLTTMSRPLRKLYLDPITNNAQWGIVPAAGGGVMGVYSLSQQKPIKVGGFPPLLAGFAGATSYQNWQFIYQP